VGLGVATPGFANVVSRSQKGENHREIDKLGSNHSSSLPARAAHADTPLGGGVGILV